MRIALDAATGGTNLAPCIEGAITAANAWGVELVLVGPAADIRSALTARGIAHSDRRFEVIDALDLLPLDEDPAEAGRERPSASLLACARLAAEGRAMGLVCAGHAGTAAAAMLGNLKRLTGVLRPALAATLPTPRGHTVLLDVGAHGECKPWHLLQFAVMGVSYCRRMLRVAEPSVGVLASDADERRGPGLVRETLALLKASGLNCRGPVEGHELAAGAADVVVCDGFVGNVALKLTQGVSASVLNAFRAEIRRNHFYKAGGLILRRPFNRLKKRLNPDECGGATLLGVNGNVVVAHSRTSAGGIGSSAGAGRTDSLTASAKSIADSLRAVQQLAERGLNAHIQQALAETKLGLETVQAQLP